MDLVDIEDGIIVFVRGHYRRKGLNFFLILGFDNEVFQVEQFHFFLFGARLPTVGGFLVVC